MKKLIKVAIIDSVGAIAYVFLIAVFLQSAQIVFGNTKDTILAPIVMLLLLILSATITGSLVFGRSVLWYLDGNKKEAITLILYKVVILFLMVVIVLGAMCLGVVV